MTFPLLLLTLNMLSCPDAGVAAFIEQGLKEHNIGTEKVFALMADEPNGLGAELFGSNHNVKLLECTARLFNMALEEGWHSSDLKPFVVESLDFLTQLPKPNGFNSRYPKGSWLYCYEFLQHLLELKKSNPLLFESITDDHLDIFGATVGVLHPAVLLYKGLEKGTSSMIFPLIFQLQKQLDADSEIRWRDHTGERVKGVES